MKVWLKYLIGIAIGILAAILLPVESVQAKAVLDFIVEVVIRFGRFTLLPLVFFSVVTASFKLHDEKLSGKTVLWTAGTIVLSSLMLVTLGIISATIIHLPRIPITIEKVNDTASMDFKGLITSLFPYSGFQALLDGAYLLPCLIFAYIAGAGANADKAGTKTAVTWFESVSRICYIVMSFCTELLSVGMIAIMFKWSVDFVQIYNAKVFNPLFLMLLIDLLIVAVVIYPVLTRVICHDRHPYRVLYASISSLLVAFFSGDSNLVLPVNIRVGKESLGIRRRINAFTFPVFSVFGRGGAALVETVCFILILRSYSSLNINLSSVLWIGGISFLLSFCLGNIPMGGPFIAITVMFGMYGNGFDAGYLLLKEAAPVICSFAAAFDAVTAMFGSYMVAVKTGMVERKEVSRFI